MENTIYYHLLKNKTKMLILKFSLGEFNVHNPKKPIENYLKKKINK